MDGWIKLHRKLTHSSSTFIHLNAIQFKIAVFILLKANHKDAEWFDKQRGEMVLVKRGQLILSLATIMDWFAPEDQATMRKVRTALDKLEKLKFMTKEATKLRYTLVTVNNYDTYQEKEAGDKVADKAATKQRQSSDKGTDNKQEGNKELQEDKEDKKRTYAKTVTMFEWEYATLCKKHGLGPTLEMIEILDAYKDSLGKKYKSDYSAVNSWVARRWKEDQAKDAKYGRGNEANPGSGQSITQGRNGRHRPGQSVQLPNV